MIPKQLNNTIFVIFLLIGSTVYGQQPSVYGKLDTLEIFNAMLHEIHGPEGSNYYINGEHVRKIIYDDKRMLFDNKVDHYNDGVLIRQ